MIMGVQVAREGILRVKGRDRLRRPEAAFDACRGGRTLGRQGDGAYQSVRLQLVGHCRMVSRGSMVMLRSEAG